MNESEFLEMLTAKREGLNQLDFSTQEGRNKATWLNKLDRKIVDSKHLLLEVKLGDPPAAESFPAINDPRLRQKTLEDRYDELVSKYDRLWAVVRFTIGLALAVGAAVLLFGFPEIFGSWLAESEIRLQWQLNIMFLVVGSLWAGLDTKPTRRTFALSTIVMAAIFAIVQLL